MSSWQDSELLNISVRRRRRRALMREGDYDVSSYTDNKWGTVLINNGLDALQCTVFWFTSYIWVGSRSHSEPNSSLSLGSEPGPTFSGGPEFDCVFGSNELSRHPKPTGLSDEALQGEQVVCGGFSRLLHWKLKHAAAENNAKRAAKVDGNGKIEGSCRFMFVTKNNAILDKHY